MAFCFIELDGSSRYIKKSGAKRVISSGRYEQIGAKTYRAIERRREKRGLEVVEVAYCDRNTYFDYDYPEQREHPELQLIPAMRYPVDIARQGLTSYGPSL